jgi:hypothetical protein
VGDSQLTGLVMGDGQVKDAKTAKIAVSMASLPAGLDSSSFDIAGVSCLPRFLGAISG